MMSKSIVTNFIAIVFLLIFNCFECNKINPGCLHTANTAIDLTSYPVGGSPVSWIMSPGSSLFGAPDYLPITTPPHCESISFHVPLYKRHLNTTFFGNNILITEKVTSTQDLARDFTGLSDLVVIADEQTRGKGRGGQSWISPSGDIHMSINVNLTNRNLAPLLQSIAALSVVNAVHEKLSGYQKIDLAYVWPNSIAWNNGKLKIGGVLVEQSTVDDSWFTIGIGFRLNSVAGVPTLNSIIAAHNHMYGTKLDPIRREELTARVLNNLETLIEMTKKNSSLVRDLLAAKWVSRKKKIHLSFTGIVNGVSDNNELVLKDSRGIQVLLNPDIHIISSDDIVLAPVSYQFINQNSVYSDSEQ